MRKAQSVTRAEGKGRPSTIEAPAAARAAAGASGRREPNALLCALGLLAAVAGVVAAAAIALSPDLRQRLLGGRTGLIAVTVDSTPPGADAFIDEEPQGSTPTHASLAPGQHDVRIVRPGYKPWRGTLDPAQTPSLAPVLQPLELATLVVESQPHRAHVLLDGERRGTTPVTLSNVEAGAHTVRVDGEPLYQATTRQIQLKAGETRRLSMRLASWLEAFYRDRIEEQPGKLANYADLVRHLLDEERADDAAAVATKGLRVVEGAEASPEELQQFYTQLDLVCSGRAEGAASPAMEELLEAVRALFARLTATKPGEPERYLPLANTLGRAGRFEKMLEACDQALQAGQAPVVHISIAQAYLTRGEPKPAILVLEHATRLRPDYYDAHYRLGTACHRDGRYDDAFREYETAARLTAAAPAEFKRRLQTEIARVLADKGDLDGAVARYEKALGLDAPAGGIDLARGLIAHYPFDKDASDASGKGHHGENHGAAPVAEGRMGGAFSFDGKAAYVGIPAQATKGLTSVTLALWVKTTQSEAQSRWSYWTNPALLGVATDGYGSGDLALMLEKGNVAYFHGLTPNETDVWWFSAVPVNDDRWHHIAFVDAGPVVLVYVDGRLARGAANSGAGTPVSDTPSGGAMGSAALFIGATNLAFGQPRAGCFYRGLIDDVRIWNRALRAAEIAALCAKAK